MTDTAPNSPRSTRDAILDAAEAVVSADGGARLTIDAVVTQSGFSKGGVLYHFPNKTALLTAMVERMVDGVKVEVDAAHTKAQHREEASLPHVIDAMLAHRKPNEGVSTALLAASAEQPELLDPVRRFLTDFISKSVEDAPDPTLATIVLLAIDGLHFGELLGIDYIDPDQRAAIDDRLSSLIREMYS